jgi:flagellar biosynthesis protein FlhB
VSNDRKTEPPTPRRLRRARRDGDHPTSRLLVASGSMLCAVLAAPLVLKSLQRAVFDSLVSALHSPGAPAAHELASRVGAIVSPVLGAAALGALLIGLWQTQGVLSAKPFGWDLRRMSPFGRKRGAGSGLSLLITGIGSLATLAMAWFVLKGMGPALAHGIGDLNAALELTVRALEQLIWGALVIGLATAALDALHQQVAWRARLRMTPEEARQERRENDGDPEIRQARRQVHLELGAGAQLERVAGASLIVLGTPQLAVALGYDAERDAAPRVTVRGSGALALSIEALATSYGVPVEHDGELARALAQVPVGHDIPRTLYADVARLLQHFGVVRPARPPA